MKKSLFTFRKFLYHHPVYHFSFIFFGFLMIDLIWNNELSEHRWWNLILKSFLFAVLLTFATRMIWQQSDQRKKYED